jgi:transcriptional regulator GlxA family with amidase domain
LDKRVEKILETMRDDVRGEVSLAELAQSVNLSVWRLCHIFKSDVGMPPIKYLRLLRMESAKGLLESSFLSVKEIAYQVGLNDESHFVRDFKSTYGYSPAISRAQFRHSSAGNGNGNGNGNGKSADQLTHMKNVAEQNPLMNDKKRQASKLVL